MTTNSQPFLAARDFLLSRRTDYATAVRHFRWPKPSEFNWVLDYFDTMAQGRYQLTMLDPDSVPFNEDEVALLLDVRPLDLMLCFEDSPRNTAEVIHHGYYRTDRQRGLHHLRRPYPRPFLAHGELGSAELAGNILAFASEQLAPYKWGAMH